MEIYSATLLGVKPTLVSVEVDVSSGPIIYQIVGLPDAVVRESRTRVKSAIKQSGFDFPEDQRVIVNLAPSRIKKEGSGFELAIAAQILSTTGQITLPPNRRGLLLGELGLNGTLKSCPELTPLCFASLSNQIDFVVVPKSTAAVLKGLLNVPIVEMECLEDFLKPKWWERVSDPEPATESVITDEIKLEDLSFSEFWAKHLKIALVGSHHYLLMGPPGTGKTFFAESLIKFKNKILEQSNLKLDPEKLALNFIFERNRFKTPFASPHHSASIAGLVGGGSPPKPGAVTEAHGGILFLDEMLEFSIQALDSLRQPIEKGYVVISRAGQQVRFPSEVQLIGATNPCKCGMWKSEKYRCRCGSGQRQQYLSRLSGPFFDRFDVRLMITSLQRGQHRVGGDKILSEVIKILDFKNGAGKISLSEDAVNLLNQSKIFKDLNIRARLKIISLATTLAVIDLSPQVSWYNLEEAYRLNRLNLDDGYSSRFYARSQESENKKEI